MNGFQSGRDFAIMTKKIFSKIANFDKMTKSEEVNGKNIKCFSVFSKKQFKINCFMVFQRLLK